MRTAPWDEQIAISFAPDSQARHVTVRDIVDFFLTMSEQELQSVVVQLPKPLRVWDDQEDDTQWPAKGFQHLGGHAPGQSHVIEPLRRRTLPPRALLVIASGGCAISILIGLSPAEVADHYGIEDPIATNAWDEVYPDGIGMVVRQEEARRVLQTMTGAFRCV